MRKLIITIGAVMALAAPATALAASPNADGWTIKDNTTYDQSNQVALYTAHLIHDGWSVGGNKHQLETQDMWNGADQTVAPGSRAANVQAALGH